MGEWDIQPLGRKYNTVMYLQEMAGVETGVVEPLSNERKREADAGVDHRRQKRGGDGHAH
eukprot:9494854-Pyramimonas_sp.AAC.1